MIDIDGLLHELDLLRGRQLTSADGQGLADFLRIALHELATLRMQTAVSRHVKAHTAHPLYWEVRDYGDVA